MVNYHLFTEYLKPLELQQTPVRHLLLAEDDESLPPHFVVLLHHDFDDLPEGREHVVQSDLHFYEGQDW
jgi:hypothetical protein